MRKEQPYMWRFVPILQSSTMRALLVGGVSWLLQTIGVPNAVADEDAARWVELGLQVIEGAAFAWAAWTRYHHPTPPLALTKARAEQKNAAALAAAEDDDAR